MPTYLPSLPTTAFGTNFDSMVYVSSGRYPPVAWAAHRAAGA